jgi:predicted dehydrogenase
LDAGYERILIEKPGSENSEDLEKLIIKAEEKGITMYINYQRSFDTRVAELFVNIRKMVSEGYSLDYVSVYSCDKEQPPQAAHQYLNQGCHDYALLLCVFEASGMKLKDLQSRGVEWKGTGGDTKFFKVTGTAGNEESSALFDVQMGRVNSSGSFTTIYCKLSKFDEASKMYIPFESTLNFPEVSDPNANWADVWKGSFEKSAEALFKGEGGVPATFGLNILRFAEMAGKSLKEKSSLIVND